MLRLKRIALLPQATLGVLLWHEHPFALALERPWRGNQRGVSCIPAGNYLCLRCRVSPDYDFKDSPNFGDTYQVHNVPGRSQILFHKGNINDDTHGCILVGEQFEPVRGHQDAIKASAEGFAEFLRITAGVDQFTLAITEH